MRIIFTMMNKKTARRALCRAKRYMNQIIDEVDCHALCGVRNPSLAPLLAEARKEVDRLTLLYEGVRSSLG